MATMPKIWARWQIKIKNTNEILKLRIQDANKDQIDKLLDFLELYMLPDEHFQKACGIYKSENAIKEYKQVFTALINDEKTHAVVCCTDEDSNNLEPSCILGLSIMALESSEDTDEEKIQEMMEAIQTPEMKKIKQLLVFLKESCEEIKLLGVEKYYSGLGVSVHRDYRGYGIGSQLVKTRRLITKEHGAEATGAWMTSVGTQKAAYNDGWSVIFEMPFEELGEKTSLVFEQAPPLCKMMAAKV